MIKQKRLTVLWIAITAGCVSVPAADEIPTPVNSRQQNSAALPEEKSEGRLTKLFANGKKLKQVVFSGNETWNIRQKDGSLSTTRATFSGAFDYESNRIRFDYKSASDPKTDYFYFESPAGRVIYSRGTGFKILSRPIERHRDRPREIFDVRCLGIVTEPELGRGMLQNLQVGISEATDTSSVQVSAEGLHLELLRVTAGGVGHLRHQFDVNRNHTPVLLEQRYQRAPGEPLSAVANRVTTKWQKEGDVWVPTSVMMQRLRKKQPVRVRKLQFQWKSANNPIPAATFDHMSLKPQNGTRVVDQVLDPDNPVVIKTIGKP